MSRPDGRRTRHPRPAARSHKDCPTKAAWVDLLLEGKPLPPGKPTEPREPTDLATLEARMEPKRRIHVVERPGMRVRAPTVYYSMGRRDRRGEG